LKTTLPSPVGEDDFQGIAAISLSLYFVYEKTPTCQQY